jgi:hypothetical protein
MFSQNFLEGEFLANARKLEFWIVVASFFVVKKLPLDWRAINPFNSESERTIRKNVPSNLKFARYFVQRHDSRFLRRTQGRAFVGQKLTVPRIGPVRW